MPVIRIILMLLGLAVHLGADTRKCVVCETPLTGPFYWMTTPALPEKLPVCESCSKLDTVCAHCRIPLVKNYHTLRDGRLLCQKGYDAAIFTETEALRVFESAKHDVQRFLHGYGVVPERNVSVSLVDSNELGRLITTVPSWHLKMVAMGLTRTRPLGPDQFEHSIYILNGLDAGSFTSVAAHEYTHAWIHENVPKERKLDPNAVEGFCELLAYKVAVDRQAEIQKRIIMANAYTRGQINAFVQAEDEHQFHRVVHWMKTGVDEMLSETNRTRLLTVKRVGPAPLLWPPPAPVQTVVPSVLTLKGISGAEGNRFALINDRTLMKNETGRVRVGTSNVVVRCLDIKAQSAVIEVDGAKQPVELRLVGR